MSEDQPKAQELEVRILVLRVAVIGISFLDIGRKPMALWIVGSYTPYISEGEFEVHFMQG